jgi:hypothetical protein
MEVKSWIVICIFIATTLVVAFCSISAWKYYEIYNDPEPNNNLSEKFALGLFISSIVVGFINLLIWLWCIYRAMSYTVNSRSSQSFEDILRSQNTQGEFYG